MRSTLAATLLGIMSLSAFAQPPSAKGVNFYSIPREIELGRQIADGVEKSLAIIHEPKLNAYIARLGAEMVQYADNRFAYGFTLYDDRNPPFAPLSRLMATPADGFGGEELEPVAIAGGPIFVPLGLLSKAHNEAEFAFQLAHAIAHIALRHATRQATREQIITQAGIPVQTSMPVQQPTAVSIGFLTFARGFELQADKLAVGIVAEAGYDPAEMARYLERQPPSRGMRSQVFSARPTASQRLEAVSAAIGGLPARAYSADSGEFKDMKALAGSVR